MECKIVILTKSSKNHGYCVAGIDVDSGEWIRLVSSNDKTQGALDKYDIQYRDGTSCKPLDVVRVPIIREVPSEYQPENILIDSSKKWEKCSTLQIEEVLQIHPEETHKYLLGNQYSYITAARVGVVGHSLVLVRVNNIDIMHPKAKSTKATFEYRGTVYKDVSVTDPDFYAVPEMYHINEAIFVISLPNTEHKDKYYKFIAKIFVLD